MLFYVAKLIQAIGFADVGYALYVGMTKSDGLAAELRLTLVGVALFYAGRLLERRASA